MEFAKLRMVYQVCNWTHLRQKSVDTINREVSERKMFLGIPWTKLIKVLRVNSPIKMRGKPVRNFDKIPKKVQESRFVGGARIIFNQFLNNKETDPDNFSAQYFK